MHPLFVLVYMNMRKDYEKLFSHLKSPEPPDGLFEKIILRLRKEQKLISLKRRLIIFSIGLIGSAVAFISAFQAVQKGFTESGFIEFLSLLFSDAGVIMTYWQNFALSLLETFPTMSLVALLAIGLIFLESLKLLAKDIKILIFLPKHN